MAVEVKIVPEEGRTAKEEVVADIKEFEKWFMDFLKNGEPLRMYEKTIINDYLAWKTGQTQG